MGRAELTADDAWRALRRYGGWHLVRDAFLRFRYGDGFSHARALGLQLCLAGVPFLIALRGLASKLGIERGGRVVADVALALSPGASDSLVRDMLVNNPRTEHAGAVALVLGLLTGVAALTTAIGQFEQGANRIYGVQRDRPALAKYSRALVLTLTAGLPTLAGFVILVAGDAFGTSVEHWYHPASGFAEVWGVLRWPLSLGLTVLGVAVLFRRAPRRHQPGLSWLLVGAGLTTVWWAATSLLLAWYVNASGGFGATYGPLTAVIALLLWANLTGIALFLGLAFAAQLEARRVGVAEPTAPDRWQPLDERIERRPQHR